MGDWVVPVTLLGFAIVPVAFWFERRLRKQLKDGLDRIRRNPDDINRKGPAQ